MHNKKNVGTYKRDIAPITSIIRNLKKKKNHEDVTYRLPSVFFDILERE